jgi:hypothetical protein
LLNPEVTKQLRVSASPSPERDREDAVVASQPALDDPDAWLDLSDFAEKWRS